MNPTNVRERGLARHAFDAVSRVERADQKTRDRYSTLAHRLPSLLQTAGLGQTVAFLLSKTKPKSVTGDEHLLADLGAWLVRGRRDPDGRALMDAILKAPPGEYRRMTREATLLADWLKRFAAGLLGEAIEDRT